MTTTAKLIEYLQTLPPDTLVKVLEEHTRGYETVTRWVDLTLPENMSETVTHDAMRGRLYFGSN